MFAASEIKEHMEVLGSDGEHVGTIDHFEGENRIKLTKADSGDSRHHLIPADWVDHVDAHVHLNVTSSEAFSNWEDLEVEDSGSMDMGDGDTYQRRR